MKVAVLLTGYCREYHKTYEALNDAIFTKYDTDIYISSWDSIQQRPETWDSTNPESNKEYETIAADVDGVINLYNSNSRLVNYNFENWNEYYQNRFTNISLIDRDGDIFKINERAKYHGSFWVERLRDQWWIVQKGWDLINNPNQYDIILRIRFDILLNNIQFASNQYTIPKSNILAKIDLEYCDYFAYGNSTIMRKYCNLFSNIESIYQNYNVDISHAELLLKFYMEEFQNPIITNIDENIKYKLLRKQKNMINSENKYTKMQLDFYNEEASRWSEVNREPVVGSFDAHNNWDGYNNLFTDIENINEKIAIDFGCGPGRNLVRYKNTFKRLDGVDMSPINIDKAKQYTFRNGIFDIKLYNNNGVDLDVIPNEQYDVVMSTICLQHICVYDIRKSYFKEFHRILKEGGSITIQMGYGANSPQTVGYYENYYDAIGTNRRCDVCIESTEQLEKDLLDVGFKDFKYKIDTTGPGDIHPNWIYFTATK